MAPNQDRNHCGNNGARYLLANRCSTEFFFFKLSTHTSLTRI